MTAIASLTALLGVVACTDTAPGEQGREGKEIAAEIQIENGRSSATRAIVPYSGEEAGEDELNENRIDRLQIYFFNQDGTFHSHPTNVRIENGNGSQQKRVSIRLTKSEADTYSGQSLKMVAIANVEDEAIGTITNLNQLKEMVCNQVLTQGKQTTFLMDATVETGTISWVGSLFTIHNPLTMKRAAAKIRLHLTKVDIKEGNTTYSVVGQPEVRLVHYATQTSLIEGTPAADPSYKDTEYQEMAGNPSPAYTLSLPYYAYESNWSEKSEEETFMIVKIRLQSGNGQPKPYYYRIPVNYRRAMPDMSEKEKAALHKIERNHLYDVFSEITVLGNEDEGLPKIVSSNVAITPWIEETVNGNIKKAHYLAVMDHHPQLLNEESKTIGYVSDLPVKIENKNSYYFSYSSSGAKTKKAYTVNTPEVSASSRSGQKGVITIKHPVDAKLYVPLHIEFDVKQYDPMGTGGQMLTEHVHAIQYPPKFVTAKKSAGLKGGTSVVDGKEVYADFRYHDLFGLLADTPDYNTPNVTKERKPQNNDQLYRITTYVNDSGEFIGDPFDPKTNMTYTDEEHNNIISPEFIIASQHGISLQTGQYVPTGKQWNWVNTPFENGYGPFFAEDHSPYGKINGFNQIRVTYTTAAERCKNYFEDEYGHDGNYIEYYVDEYGYERQRTVHKKFKYNGYWRLPTYAELKYIDDLQKEGSANKYLLWGDYYWTAYKKQPQEQKGYDRYTFNSQTTDPWPYTRCVFDTYRVNDKDENYE